jgi:hypothetical protein
MVDRARPELGLRRLAEREPRSDRTPIADETWRILTNNLRRVATSSWLASHASSTCCVELGRSSDHPIDGAESRAFIPSGRCAAAGASIRSSRYDDEEDG